MQLSFNYLYIFGRTVYYVMELGCCLSQVPDLVVHEEEVYEDEDDENDESNWRNDYPDEDSDADSDREERYGGGYSLRRSHFFRFKPNATKACRGKRCTSLFFLMLILTLHFRKLHCLSGVSLTYFCQSEQ